MAPGSLIICEFIKTKERFFCYPEEMNNLTIIIINDYLLSNQNEISVYNF